MSSVESRKIVIGTHDEVAASEQKSVADKPRAAARPPAKQVAVPPSAPAG